MWQGKEIQLTLGNDYLIKIHHGDKTVELELPEFEVDGKCCKKFSLSGYECTKLLTQDGREFLIHFALEEHPYGMLHVTMRAYPKQNALRFRYKFVPNQSCSMTKITGHDNIKYTALHLCTTPTMCEIQFSQFEPLMHTFIPQYNEFNTETSFHKRSLIGPMLILEQGLDCILLAYEHGAQAPDAFLEFRTCGGEISVNARKGNYYHGMELDKPFESVWFDVLIGSCGRKVLLSNFRSFLDKCITENTISRTPFIFYNTWNRQERDRNHDKKPFLHSMNQDAILEEIEVAHKMGIEVFVIDTGWFQKTGDWQINEHFFPDGMEFISNKLREYGMQLGLWFNPTVAAKTSMNYLEHPEHITSRLGKDSKPFPIWETEDSYSMCLCSDYTDSFIQSMIDINKKWNVTYFKWDAIGQYGCDKAGHFHGTEANSPDERLDCYAYQMGLQMQRIVEEVTMKCPNIIVDFDITEGDRYVGLGFLSSGKYFLINNGAYARDLDLPESYKLYHEPKPVHMDSWTNLYFQPGPARNTLCRHGMLYDDFCPSTLFLVHYLPDGPKKFQRNAMASLVLGGNGIWGYLAKLSEDDILFWKTELDAYKLVREYVAASYPIRVGFPGSSPEIHEKLVPSVGKGSISIFTRKAGSFTHITQTLENIGSVIGADKVELLADGSVQISVTLEKDDAKVIYFY